MRFVWFLVLYLATYVYCRSIVCEICSCQDRIGIFCQSKDVSDILEAFPTVYTGGREYPELNFQNAIGLNVSRLKPEQLIGIEILDIRGTGQQCPPKYYVLAEIECYHDAPIATTETVGNDTITFPPKAPRPREPYNLTDSTNATETSINSTTHVFSTPIYPHDDDDDDNYGQGPYTEGWILFIVAICSIPIICCLCSRRLRRRIIECCSCWRWVRARRARTHDSESVRELESQDEEERQPAREALNRHFREMVNRGKNDDEVENLDETEMQEWITDDNSDESEPGKKKLDKKLRKKYA